MYKRVSLAQIHFLPYVRDNRMLLKLVTGNGVRGTGNRERESGDECTAVTRVKIQQGGQKKRKGNNLGKCKEVLWL